MNDQMVVHFPGTRLDAGSVMSTSEAQRAHEQATRAPIHEVVSSLERVLGRSGVAFMAGVKAERAVARWTAGERRPRRESERRLRLAYQVWALLREQEDEDTVRAWFGGMNPHLDDVSPGEAIASGDLRGALLAARSFLSQ